MNNIMAWHGKMNEFYVIWDARSKHDISLFITNIVSDIHVSVNFEILSDYLDN